MSPIALNFSQHARDRMRERGITVQQVMEVLEDGEECGPINQPDGKTVMKYARRGVTVLVGSDQSIVTVFRKMPASRISSWFRIMDDSDECEAAARAACSETWQFGKPLSFIDYRFIVDKPENRTEPVPGDET
jgi:hypothetical protein